MECGKMKKEIDKIDGFRVYAFGAKPFFKCAQQLAQPTGKTGDCYQS